MGDSTAANNGLLDIGGGIFINPSESAVSRAILSDSGWQLGSSLSRSVKGSMVKTLKTKWRIGNAANGPIVAWIAFNSKLGKTLIIVHHHSLQDPNSTILLQ